MRTSDKYRFTLQWSAETAEKIQAGDFLESLGNRKSEVIVLAINEYLASHPETLAGGKPQIVVRSSPTREELRAMVLAMIEEKLPGSVPAVQTADAPGGKPAIDDTDVDEMLKNLDFF